MVKKQNFVIWIQTVSSQTYSYLIDDGSEDKKAKGTKMCIIEKEKENKEIK